jgi:PKD repeat protein
MKSLVFLILILFSMQAFSQNWERTYGGIDTEEGGSVVQTSDSGFIVAASSNSFGSGIFDFYLLKLDGLGDTIWTETYGGVNNDRCRSVIQTFDGGFIACGESNSFSNSNDIYMVKTDVNGLIEWTKTIGDSNSESADAIVQTSDSGYCMAGIFGNIGTGTTRVLLVRTDVNGDTLWKKTFGRDILNIGSSLQQTPDNGFIVSGASYDTAANVYDVFLIKTDSSGDTLWTKYISTGGHAYAHSVILADSGYVIGGISKENYLFLSIDLNGNVHLQKEYDKGGLDRCFSITQTPDKGYMMGGYSSAFNNSDILVLKIDSVGNELWSKYYGGTGREEGYSIQSLPAGGFVTTGFTQSFGINSQDLYVVRSDCNSFPVVQISVLDTVCLGDTIATTLIANAGSAVTLQWTLNDTIIAGANSATQIFSQAGMYHAIATDSNGCSNISNTIAVSLPSSFFATNPHEACPDDRVIFGNWFSGTDRYQIYDWDFGDGITDTGFTVTHAFADTGWYNVERSVRTANGNCNFYGDSIHITTTAIPPVDFDMLVNSSNMLYTVACPGDRVEFIPYAYTYLFVPLPPFEASRYHWDFGDGNTDTVAFPVHYYTQTGKFAVTFTVTNHCGNTNSVTDSILVDSTVIPDAFFYWTDMNGVSFDTVLACEQVLFSTQGGIDYHWDFDDGIHLMTVDDSVHHAFATAGTYNVLLSVSNNCGNSDTSMRTIIVSGTCTGISNAESQQEYAIVFPNPFSESATIRLSEMEGYNSFELLIFDLRGQVVQRRKVSGQEIKIDRIGLIGGIYYYSLGNEKGGKIRGRFVVQ